MKTAEEIKKYNREYDLKRRGRIRFRTEYYRQYNEKRRLKAQEDRKKLREEVLAILGNKCKQCGFSDKRALQIDHVNGGGNKQRKIIHQRYETFILKDVKENPEKYQLLCANCNWIKRNENKEYKFISTHP